MDGNGKYDKPEVQFCPSEKELGNWTENLNILLSETALTSVMKSLAVIVNACERNHIDRLPCRTYHLALDWLATLKQHMESIRFIEFETGCADSDGNVVHGTEHAMYMAYSTDVISDEAAERVLKSGTYHNDPRVVVLSPVQAAALFPAVRRCAGSASDS